MTFGHVSNNKPDKNNSVSDISALYSSPSMPNISLGGPLSNSVLNLFILLVYDLYIFKKYYQKIRSG